MNITKKNQEDAAYIFGKNLEVDKLYMNSKGEFFTQEHLAKASGKKVQLITFERPAEKATEYTGNDLPTLEEMKAKGEELPKFLDAMVKADLTKIADSLELKLEGKPTNAVIIEQIVKVVNEAE
ncbi:MAG: hypothetical protein JXR60_12240 [Bacteroidales bacterium]|nr:hypothetical protein [Bacteroidales bacterium]